MTASGWLLRLVIAWDCRRGRHTPRVIDGEIRCKFCGKDQSW